MNIADCIVNEIFMANVHAIVDEHQLDGFSFVTGITLTRLIYIWSEIAKNVSLTEAFVIFRSLKEAFPALTVEYNDFVTELLTVDQIKAIRGCAVEVSAA